MAYARATPDREGEASSSLVRWPTIQRQPEVSRRRIGTICRTELTENVSHVEFDRLFRKEQLLGDPRVRLAMDYGAQHIELSPCQDVTEYTLIATGHDASLKARGCIPVFRQRDRRARWFSSQSNSPADVPAHVVLEAGGEGPRARIRVRSKSRTPKGTKRQNR
jgi:hypothetical protein